MKTYKKAYLTAGLVLLAIFSWWVFGYFHFFQFAKNTVEISLSGEIFQVEIADDLGKRSRGLAGRESLCDRCGMLFVFEKVDYRNFWMKDMQFNLDIIWLEGERIVAISSDIPYARGEKEVISSPRSADRVLEVNAQESARLGLKVGDEIRIKK